MKDNNGLYYYPFPANKRVRMYVKACGPEVLFRMWNADDAEMWDTHGWVPFGAIRQAMEMYQKNAGGFDPRRAYDIDLARALIREDAGEKTNS